MKKADLYNHIEKMTDAQLNNCSSNPFKRYLCTEWGL